MQSRLIPVYPVVVVTKLLRVAFTRYLSERPRRVCDCDQRLFPAVSCRVAVQNERYDDWTPVLSTIRHQFMGYRESLLNFHRERAPPGAPPPPRAALSSAAQGNFLEVLNMSMNGEPFSSRLCRCLYGTAGGQSAAPPGSSAAPGP